MSLAFHHGHGSPCSWRVWLALEHLDERFGKGKARLCPDVACVKRIGAKKPESKPAGILPPAIAQWAARIEALPYFGKTFPPRWRS